MNADILFCPLIAVVCCLFWIYIELRGLRKDIKRYLEDR